MTKGALSLLLAVLCALSSPSAFAGRAIYAIVIGNNQPPAADTALRPLRYADDDAVRYYEFFTRLGARAELFTVLDVPTQKHYPGLAQHTRPPTLAELRATLQALRPLVRQDADRGEKPVLFITFSGHGASEPAGEYALSFLDGGLTQRILYDEVLAGFERAQVHLIVDACHAAGVVGVRGQFDRELDAETVVLEKSKREQWVEQRSLARLPNVGALIASSATEEAHEWSRIEAGVFTHEVLSALSGAADVNRDRRIEYSEVQAFVAAANRGLAASAAKPSIIAMPPAENHRAFLVDLGELRDSIVLEGVSDGLGHFYVEDGAGRRLVDAHFERAQGFTLAVPRSPSPLFLRTADREARIPADSPVVVAKLAFAKTASQSRGAVDTALHAGLFASPYSPEYYRGYVDSMGLVAVDFDGLRAAASAELPAPTGHRGIGTGLAIASGASFVAALSLGIAALFKKQQFDRTDLQKESRGLAGDYKTLGYASLAAAAVGVATGVGATLLLWPRVEPAHGGLGMGWEVGLQARF